MKALLLLLACLLCAQVVTPAVISLEEGDSTTKRTMKWAMDPVEDPLPLPRFEIQNGEDNDYQKFALLGTLDCSAYDENDVAMAIYDLATSEWGCTLTSALPNDDAVPTGQPEGLLESCDEAGRVAVWSRTSVAWGCSPAKPLLNQAEPNIQSACRQGDLLTLNLDFDGRPAALCDTSSTRQVGPNAVVSLKKRSKSRNVGDPDEAFFVQTTSKAIGRAAEGTGQYGWQYFKWSPSKSSFASSMGTYPPTFPFTKGNLAAVTVATYSYDGASFSSTTLNVVIRVVKITPQATSFQSNDWSSDLAVTSSPASFVSDGTGTRLSTTDITTGEAASIRIISVPASLTGSSHTTSWMSVSLWISHIEVEA